MKKKMLFVMATIVSFALFVPSVLAAAVTSEEEFVTTIKEGKSVEIVRELSIKLEEDLTITSKVTVGAFSGSKVAVTIDLNGHTVKLNGSSAQFYVQKTGKLIIGDSVGTGLITNKDATSSNSYLVQVTGDCEINGGTLENTVQNSTPLYIQNETSTCTLNDGTIVNSYTKGGKTVYVNKGTFTMNGGKVENKAAGSDGLTTAIDGNNVIMTGGTIEAAGTGITSTAASVEITGGTINAGWFGLHTRYATVEPAEGEEVNISAGRAAIIAYSAPSTGKGNKIYGGNFVAPVLMESKYVSDATNVEVYGGTYSVNVGDYLVNGKYLEKVGEVYEVKEYTQTPDITPVDPEEEVEDTTIGVTDNEETGDILMDSLEDAVAGDAELEEAVQNNNVVVVVDVTSKDTEELDEEVLEKIEDAAKDLVVANYFDIKVLVNDDNNNNLGVITNLTKEIELIILLPEELVNTNEKVERKYYVIREHNGEVEIIDDVKLSEDGRSLIFESDKFSTYALAYEDEAVKEELPPKTGDINLFTLIGTILVGMAGLAIVLRKRFAKSN